MKDMETFCAELQAANTKNFLLHFFKKWRIRKEMKRQAEKRFYFISPTHSYK